MYNEGMRTTIELSDEHRAKLLELSVRRNKKGFSGLIAEALDNYLENADLERAKIRRALAAGGTLPDDEAGQMRRYTRKLRQSW